LRETKVRFRTGPKGKRTCHAVLEVTSEVRNALLEKPRIYINYTSHAIKDYLVVSRCFKCADLGHITRYCDGQEVCSHCGSKDHKKDNCPRKEQQRTCIPCLMRKKDCKVTDYKECATYKSLLARIVSKTDYG